jgi:hypothetical protein
MGSAIINTGLQQTTTHKVVLPFYTYAAISFIIATILVVSNTNAFTGYYFNPATLAIVHTMALGWGTMIILGASHQLLPVIIEGKLSSNSLAHASFYLTGSGIPFLVASFYFNNFTTTMQIGAVLINLGVLAYLINVLKSVLESPKKDIHAWYMSTASLWLFATTFFGLLLVFNFQYSLLSQASLNYLSIHAHLGIIGWFILLVVGVGSRLIPMFLISKYTNDTLLKWVYMFINLSLVSFIVLKVMNSSTIYYYLPIGCILLAISSFAYFAYQAYKVRIRKKVDEQVGISLISVGQLFIPVIILIITLFTMPQTENHALYTLYGFSVFFGWLTAIILGMTFKTLPFIVWNKVYHNRTLGKTPTPKELFHEKTFNFMSIFYLIGFIIFAVGLFFANEIILIVGASFLCLSAILYGANVGITLLHKPKTIKS